MNRIIARKKQSARLNQALSEFDEYSALLSIEIEKIVSKWPETESRAIRAERIIMMGGVKLLHWNHFKVASRENHADYIVARYVPSRCAKQGNAPKHWNCTCPDWANGKAVHVWHFDRLHPPPYIDELGIVCEHVLASMVWLKLSGVQPCPICRGNCIKKMPNEWGERMEPCKWCNATGAIDTLPHIEEGWELPFQIVGVKEEFDNLLLDDLQEVR